MNFVQAIRFMTSLLDDKAIMWSLQRAVQTKEFKCVCSYKQVEEKMVPIWHTHPPALLPSMVPCCLPVSGASNRLELNARHFWVRVGAVCW